MSLVLVNIVNQPKSIFYKVNISGKAMFQGKTASNLGKWSQVQAMFRAVTAESVLNSKIPKAVSNIDRPLGEMVSMGERLSQRELFFDFS